jgi:hypothetical protein
MSDPAPALIRLVGRYWPAADAFFERATPDLSAPQSVGFRALYASVPRRLGALAEASVEPPAELAASTRPHWTLTDYARAALVASAFATQPDEWQAAAHLHLFEAGEIGEQVSLLRTLPLLTDGARFLESGLQACRTNARSVFEAMVCENPFVAEHFPALNFNQAVLKAIFMEVSARRIEGLEARITPELQRMAAGYKSERLAAGRTVPVDIDYLIQYGA